MAPEGHAVTRAERIAALRATLRERLLVLDGAMGTAIQALGLSAADFGGPAQEGCNEVLVATRPDVIQAIHARYFEAGADIAETDTFGGTPWVLTEYGLAERTRELNRTAARLAREVAERFSTPARPRFVAGSMGPTTRSISVTGGVTFAELAEHYLVQARGLYEGGADYLLLETCQDTLNVKAGLSALRRLAREVDGPLPVAVSVTIEASGTMLAGQSIEALIAALEHEDLLYLGLNCATGPEPMTDPLRTLARMARAPVACVPNAGLPDEDGRYRETPEAFSHALRRFGEAGWLNLVGGCCGTTPDHIRAVAEAARSIAPRAIPAARRACLSGIDYLELSEDARPVLVGERTNVIGSRKFKELIAAGKLDEASEIARAQVRGGAQVIDVCLANPDRDEREDMRAFLAEVTRKIRVPLMIDTTDEAVVESALAFCQGKPLVNSVNLEDGGGRLARIARLTRELGAALVVGCIDDDPVQGMAVSRGRKLEVARRAFGMLREHGVPAEDIYWDPLVFPCATGDAQYAGSALETIEGVRLLKAEFPGTHTLLGISNVSFGLPAAAREVLNAVFLYHCTQAGLDLAIVNAERLPRLPSILEAEKKLAEDLLWDRGADPAGAFAAAFREKKPAAPPRERLPLDERIARHVIEGTRDGLEADLAEARLTRRPLAIINGPLMAGMEEVGRLFAGNQLIVAEVLQSAESMKAAVRILEPHMDRAETGSRGKVLLATVKGDVHDIGKNLVEIILSNNGFTVVNLGIKVPPAHMIEAVRAHRPDVVGLSGLLVKSAQQMAVTAEDMSRAGISVPLIVGGAALTRAFVDRQIAPAYGAATVAYARDAMAGLDLVRRIVDPERHRELRAELAERRAARAAPGAVRPATPAEGGTRRSALLPPVAEPPRPPDLDRHLFAPALPHVFRFVNPVMLYGRHLGLPGSIARSLAPGHEAELAKTVEGRKALDLRRVVEGVEKECAAAGLLAPAAVWRFFRAASEGNRLSIFDLGGARLAAFDFPRQPRPEGLCLADLVNPLSGREPNDFVCLFAVTAGGGVRERAAAWKDAGEYLKSHALQALALESAEGLAELVHAELRSQWGFPDDPALTMADRFKARYRGKRYSFGYPACPRLDDQRILLDLLAAEEIGIQLTDGFMMDPEASVSALVFHHPAASYFSAAAAE